MTQNIAKAAIVCFLNGYTVSRTADEIYIILRKSGYNIAWQTVSIVIFDTFKQIESIYSNNAEQISRILSDWIASNKNIDNIIDSVSRITDISKNTLYHETKSVLETIVQMADAVSA